jgi:hypothetical protein
VAVRERSSSLGPDEKPFAVGIVPEETIPVDSEKATERVLPGGGEIARESIEGVRVRPRH